MPVASAPRHPRRAEKHRIARNSKFIIRRSSSKVIRHIMSCTGVELLPRWWEKLNLPVIIVLCLFAFIYTTTVFGVTIPWLEHSVNGVLNVAVLTACSSLAMFMYLSW